MKKTIAIFGLSALALLPISNARAGVSFSIGANVHLPVPVFVAPAPCVGPAPVAPMAPVYVPPIQAVACPPRVYCPPPAVVFAPPAVVVRPPFFWLGFGHHHYYSRPHCR